jgi:hypothetical protein
MASSEIYISLSLYIVCPLAAYVAQQVLSSILPTLMYNNYILLDLRIAVLFSASKPTRTFRSIEPDVISAQTKKVSRSLGLVVNG